tara:strand:- start:1323 stop:1925 length:603 start_codon:yes stop_codon:yes gene_type:complete
MATAILLGTILGITTIFYAVPILSRTTYVQSTIDKRYYKVLNVPSRQKAADILAVLRENIEKLVTHIKLKYLKNHTISEEETTNLKDIFKRLDKLDLDEIQENELNSDHTAYSVNKGERLHFCVRSNKTGGHIQDNSNLLMYVALHEMAHVITLSRGHTKEFWKNHQLLLKEAIESKVYNPIDFSKNTILYCGQIIKTNS